MTDDIVAFIRARLDADRAAADEMQENANWMSDCGEPHNVSINLRSGWEMDSDRVRRGVEAKRRQIETLEGVLTPERPEWMDDEQWRVACAGGELLVSHLFALMASEWSAHPDYRSEWTP